MDSTLLDQIRHLCRDRAAYERLKAILVQQERVHQLSWQERYEKLMSAQVEETQASNTFGNIIAREKALAQLADAIQRSPSLELVLQVAVQVAQKLLQVDRVAIFCRHGDGRGEFTTDAIASGLVSIADMPERQLLLAKHMVDSMQSEQSSQIVDSIRSSSFSSHIVTLLEQIGISSYAANKIYAGQEAWGTLVAFHGSVYHTWSESDRTSLSLVAAQIGIAISLANMRQQSQVLAGDLQALQSELNSLQETVNEIIESKSKIEIPDNELTNASVNSLIDDDQPIITMFFLNAAEDDVQEKISDLDDSIDNLSKFRDPEVINQIVQTEENLDQEIDQETNTSDIDLEEVADQEIDQETNTSDSDLEEVAAQEDEEVIELQEIEEELDDEVIDSDYSSISQNGVPRLFLIPDTSQSSDQTNDNLNTEKIEENTTSVTEEKIDQDEEIVASNPVEEITTDSENLAGNQYTDIDDGNIEHSIDNLQTESISEVETSQSSVPEDANIIVAEVEASVSEEVNVVSADVSEDEVESVDLSETTDSELDNPQEDEVESVDLSETTDSELDNPQEDEVESVDLSETTDSELDNPQAEVAASASSLDVANVEQSEKISDSLVEAQAEAQFTSQISEPESPDSDNSPQEAIAISSAELETIIIVPPFMEVSESSSEYSVETHSSEVENRDLENSAQDEVASEVSEPLTPVSSEVQQSVMESPEVENLEQEAIALSVVSLSSNSEPHENTDLQLDTDLQFFIEPKDDNNQQDDTSQTGIEELDHNLYDEDRDPPIEPQFIETILSIAGHDEKGIKFLLDVIDSYLEETPRLVQAIDKSLSFSDHPRLLQSLNTLRSSSEYVGALALAYQCRQLESAVRANYVVLIYACLSQVAIEAQRATEALRIERSRYAE